MSDITNFSIGEFLDIINEYNYNHLIIKSYGSETIYEAYGINLIPIIDHLLDKKYDKLMDSPINFFNVFAKDKFNLTLEIYMRFTTREEELKYRNADKVAPFDFRKGA